MQIKKQQLELDMEKQTGYKLGKEYIKAVYCHWEYQTTLPAFWETCMQLKKQQLEPDLEQ